MQYKELTERIISSAFKVYGIMGFGFLESVYENCLMIELEKEDLTAEKQKEIDVFYKDIQVGKFKVDIIVQDTVIVELKSVRQISIAHEVQLVNYLTATKKPIGLIINFAEKEVQIKRKVKELPV